MNQRGFTLLEVVIALAILAVSLGVLLESQVSSLVNADRARSLTIGTLLLRSKLIDMEQKVFDDGFVVGDVDKEGDFRDEGHEEIKWKYHVAEVELDLSNLSSLCGGLGGGDATKPGAASDCEGMVGGLGGMLTGFTDEIGRSLRAAEVTVTWPAGKYKESISVHTLLTREDYNTAVPGVDATQAGIPGVPGVPGAPGVPGLPVSPPAAGAPR